MNLRLHSPILRTLLLGHSRTPNRPDASSRLVSRFSRAVRGCMAGVALFAAGASASAQLVSNGFEGGATQGWIPRGSAVLTSVTEAARSGTHSLKTTGRTSNWNGPSLDLRSVLSPNVTYQFTGWVRLVNGQPPSNLAFTMENRATGAASSSYTWLAGAAADDSGWVQLQGVFTPESSSYATLLLYLESDDPTSQYYLDDFSIVAQSAPGCPEPLDQTGLFSDFETGGSEGWFGRGPATVQNVTADSYDGDRSLAVTGRTSNWNGAAIDALCKLHKGSKYLVSLWVKLLPGEDPTNVKVSLQAGLDGATTYHTVIGNTEVTADGWVNLVTEYTFSLDVDQLQLYVEAESPTASFYIDEFLVMYLPPVPIQTDIPSLKDVLADHFPIGAAVAPAETVGQHGELLLKHFDSIVATNAMKWDALQPSEGNYNFGPADALADFARANGLSMRGHTLIWHSQTPAWVFQDAAGNPLEPGNAAHRDLLLQRMETHIHTVMGRYQDVVDAWDVVNEVIDASQPGGLRDSPWLRIIGPEFIDYAFQFASEAPGDAGLYINDYSTNDPAKREALRVVAQGLLDRGVPVDGVGHQMHINIEWPSVSQIRATMELFASMGLDNQITEMDMSVYTNSVDTDPVSDEVLLLQAYRYRDIFNLLRELDDIISSVTFWGLADDTSWLKTFPITRDNNPLLFDEQLQAKPAYWGVVDPTQLPLVPQELQVTRGEIRISAHDDLRWHAVAPNPLTSEDADGSWASFKALWNDDTLYLLVEVADPSKGGDRIEVFVEGEVYRFAGNGRQKKSGADGLIKPTRDGYRLEAAIPLGIQLSTSDEIAFDIRVTDGSGDAQASWSDIRHNEDSDTNNSGLLHLAGLKKLADARRGFAVIDGVVDKTWISAESFRTLTFVLGDSGASAEVKSLWDGNRLYILAQVSDPLLSKASPNPWEQDSVEIFLDPNNGQTTSYQSDDAQYRINFDNELSFGGAASADRITSATRIVDGGYVVEVAIELGSEDLAPSGFIGFDLQVNDDATGTGTRSSVATWNDVTGNAYNDPSQFGALRLLSRGGR